MKITNKNIDAGNAFDWGRTSKDYAKYRDIYPSVFYEKIAERGLCVANQRVLDLGTGTGVLPRNMYTYGANWTGTDISQQQIEEAKALARQMNQNISYFCVSAEDISFTSHTFDVITACQCFWYFDYERLLPKLLQYLKPEEASLFIYGLASSRGCDRRCKRAAGFKIQPKLVRSPRVYAPYFIA